MFSILAECENARLVKNKEQHIKCVYSEKRISLPFSEFTLDNGGDDRNGTRRDTYGEIEYEIDLLNRKGCSVNYCAKGKDKSRVDYVSTDDVTDGKGILLLAYSGKRGNKLGQRGTESDYGKSNNSLADTKSSCKSLSGGNEKFSTENDTSRAENKEYKL